MSSATKFKAVLFNILVTPKVAAKLKLLLQKTGALQQTLVIGSSFRCDQIHHKQL
jgi:hypothetical protein